VIKAEALAGKASDAVGKAVDAIGSTRVGKAMTNAGEAIADATGTGYLKPTPAPKLELFPKASGQSFAKPAVQPKLSSAVAPKTSVGKGAGGVKPAAVQKAAAAQPKTAPKLPPELTKQYVKDMEKRSGLKISEEQRSLLKTNLQQKNFEKLEGSALKEHYGEYIKNRSKIIVDWEKSTGQKWPTEIVKSNKNGLVKIEEKPVQLHHIIPQKRGGPNE
jgi:hypothetical protein